MIMTEWYRDDWAICDKQRIAEDYERSEAKRRAEMHNLIRGREIKSWVHVHNPVVGKCEHCGKTGVIERPEIGLY